MKLSKRLRLLGAGVRVLTRSESAAIAADAHAEREAGPIE
jgi:hypothetical protein